MKNTITILDNKKRIMLFRAPEGAILKTRQLGKGLTLLGDGKILRLPFELHDPEAAHRFADDCAPDEAELLSAPPWLGMPTALAFAQLCCFARLAFSDEPNADREMLGFLQRSEFRAVEVLEVLPTALLLLSSHSSVGPDSRRPAQRFCRFNLRNRIRLKDNSQKSRRSPRESLRPKPRDGILGVEDEASNPPRRLHCPRRTRKFWRSLSRPGSRQLS
jgi:hypothetical protein